MTHYKINEVTPEKTDITFYGVPYADADRTGHWSVWGISLLFQANRSVGMVNSFMMMDNLRTKNVGHVILKQTLDMSPMLYRYTYKTHIKLRFIMRLKEVGNSSVIFDTSLFDGDTDTLLGRNLLKFVQIDHTTRRPLPFPDWFQEKFSHLPFTGTITEMNKSVLPETPETCFRWKVIIRYSDLDKNFHSNQASYIKLCMDCATKALVAGYLRHYKDDMCWYNVEQISINYIGESFVDDELVICVWQDQEQVSKVFFSVLRKNKRIMFAEFKFGLEQLRLFLPQKL